MINSPVAVSRRVAWGSAVALALSACSSKGTPGTSGTVPHGTVAKVAVGVIPVVEVAPLYLGVHQGFFRKRGLDITAQQFPGGAAVIPAVIAGQVRFGFSNVVSLLAARDKGVPLLSLVGGGTSTGDRLRDFNAVMVRQNSRLFSARDLAGKKIAINSWNNIGDTTVRTAVHKDGGDAWKVQFVRMPFPEMPAQLASGAVDAAWVAEPFRSMILDAGGRVLFDNLTETYPKVQVAQYFTTAQLEQDDPGLVTAFVDGLRESMTFASDHPAQVRSILATYVKITPAIASAIVLPVWLPDPDTQSTAAIGEAAHRYGTLFSAPDVSGLLGR